MDPNKMRGTGVDYGDDIHQVIEGIPEPNDDSITVSSFENSQMTYSKSFNHSKKRNHRNDQNDSGNIRQAFGRDEPNFISPGIAEKTMSVDNLDLESQESPRRGREERKHLNSSALNETLDLDHSHDQRNFETRNFGNEDDRYENYQSLRYGDNTLESSSPNFKQQFPLTRTSGFHNGTNTSGFIESDGEFSDFDEEGEESEYEESDDYNQEEYIRRTDGSTDENYSLAEHTKTQFIENKELTEVMLHRRGAEDQTQNQFTGSNFKY